jgi:hypothetical protein
MLGHAAFRRIDLKNVCSFLIHSVSVAKRPFPHNNLNHHPIHSKWDAAQRGEKRRGADKEGSVFADE